MCRTSTTAGARGWACLTWPRTGIFVGSRTRRVTSPSGRRETWRVLSVRTARLRWELRHATSGVTIPVVFVTTTLVGQVRDLRKECVLRDLSLGDT